MVSLSLVVSFLHSIANLQYMILTALPKALYNAAIIILGGANGSSESDVGYSFVYELIEAHRYGIYGF